MLISIVELPEFQKRSEKIRSNAERIDKEHGVEIEFIRKSGVRKETKASRLLTLQL